MKHFGWAETKLIPEVLFFQEGPGVRKWQFRESGVKLLNGRNINDNALDLSTTSVYLSEDEANGKYSHFLAEEGDFVIACSGITIEKFDKKSAFVKKEHLPLCMNTSTMRFKSLNENVLDIRFFNYYIRSNAFLSQLQRLITGSAQLNFGPSHVKKIAIPLPPLAEQKRIAGILDEADRVRKKTQALIDKYDELAQSLFLDMFGDPVTNPKGWEKVPLNEFGNIITGNTPSRKEKSNYSENFIEWIKTDNITESNLYVTKAKEFLSEEGFKKGRVAIEGSLLVACIAGSIKSIGKANLIDRNVAFNQQINAIEPNKEVNNFFLYHLFKASPNYIQNHASSGMKRMLSKGSFGKILMILPNKSFQDEFAERVQAIETQKADANTCLGKAESCFQSLLQKAFKGELN